MLSIALYQPDIAANAGAIARLCACLGVPLHIIEPAGFAWTDAGFRRAGMDYVGLADIRRVASWARFRADARGRIVLLTTKAAMAYTEFVFREDDILLLGRESAGVPEDVHGSADARITIPLTPPARSLNVGMAAAIVAAEALRQINVQEKVPPAGFQLT
jgi:tRNA (cytidine/uridine-2'-O-)-methyltransferase